MMRRVAFLVVTAVLLALPGAGCEPEVVPFAAEDPRVAPATALIAGMRVVEEANLEFQITPPRAGRLAAYAALAHYEAVRPFIPGANSFSESVEGMPRTPPPTGDIDPTSAGVAALAKAVRALVLQDYLVIPQNVLPVIDEWRGTELDARSTALGFDVVERSVRYGEAVADTLIPWMTNDNFLVRRQSYATEPGPGVWRPTDPNQIAPLEPYWGELRPIVVEDAAACAPAAPPAFSEEEGTPFFAAAKEVFDIAASRTEEQRQVALFWNDNRRTTTPPGHWLAILHIVAAEQELSLAEASAAYALLGAAMHDAIIASWKQKYTHNVLRPRSFIHDVLDDTATWEPLFLTPPHPSFTSGHASISNAAAAVLEARIGDVTFTDTSRANDEAGLAARTYATFEEAADEAAISRVFAGIHYRFDAVGGEEQGDCVGDAVAGVDLGF